MPSSPIVQALFVLVLGVCALALWKGALAERVGAGLVLGNLIVTSVSGYFAPDSATAIIGLVADGITALGLLVIAVMYASFWLGGAMLLYAAQFSLHSFYFVTNRPNDHFHAVVNNVNFMGIITCLLLGTVIAWRRRARSLNPAPAPEA